MSTLRKLAGQTAIYGLSSIVARFLNYLLTPLYTSKGVFPPAEYGVITFFYAWCAFLNVVLTFGMETAYFRFNSKSAERSAQTYGTAFYSLLGSSVVFMILCSVFASPIASGIGYPEWSIAVLMFAGILGLDAIAVIPMARLRSEGRPWRFAMINVLNVAVNIGLNLFFLAYCMPKMKAGDSNALIDAVYDPTFGVGYVFLANLISSAVKLILLLPDMPAFRYFERQLLRPMLVFALPLLVAGLAGMVNETFDRILLKWMLPTGLADAQIGIYGACYKLAILITLFIQAFRFAAEPFFFSHAAHPQAKETFARIMNIFVAFCMCAFLLVMLFMDVFKHFIPNPAFWEGLRVVPILMLANVFLGIYYNQSVWYKLSDRTHVGGWIALLGAVITIVLNLLWIPTIGYMGSAWATLACYAAMALVSYWLGQRYWPVPYNVTRILGYMAGGVFLWWGCEELALSGMMDHAVRGVVFAAFVAAVWKLERPLARSSPQ